MNSTLQIRLSQLLTALVVLLVSGIGAFAQESESPDAEISDAKAKLFIMENLPIMNRDLATAAVDKDKEWTTELLEHAKDVIHELRHWEKWCGSAVGKSYLKTVILEQEIEEMAIRFEGEENATEKRKLKKEIQKLCGKYVDAKISFMKLQSVALEKNKAIVVKDTIAMVLGTGESSAAEGQKPKSPFDDF